MEVTANWRAYGRGIRKVLFSKLSFCGVILAVPNIVFSAIEVPRGVFSIANNGAEPLPAVLANPDVDGITLRQGWSDLEPTEGNFDFSYLDSAVAFAKGEGKADTAKLGVTGFCWGGRIVWLYAATNPGLKAGVAWYGRVVGDATPLTPKHAVDIAKDLKAPVLGLYGGADTGIPNDTVDKMREALKAGSPAAQKSRIDTYPDTPHGFNADYRPSFRKDQAEDAWKKALAWFKDNGVS
jgi:pimeloyl-ACP methyl ester carboxylesterase